MAGNKSGREKDGAGSGAQLYTRGLIFFASSDMDRQTKSKFSRHGSAERI